MWLPKWMRKKRQNEEGRLPPREFALKERKRQYDALAVFTKREASKFVRSMVPLNVFIYAIGGLCAFSFPFMILYQRRTYKTAEELFGPEMSTELVLATDPEVLDRARNPNRPPWPLLHHAIVEMREGKRGLDGLAATWDQVRMFYPEDWLIPIEIVQILKFNSALNLSQFVPDPEQLRKEVLVQLLSIKHQKVVRKSTAEIVEIAGAASMDLEAMDYRDLSHVPLVPVHT